MEPQLNFNCGADASLDSFLDRERLEALAARVRSADGLPAPTSGGAVNLHAHTFFSYNPCGYSPSRYAWLARASGLEMAGVVDFDVLDGLGEFLAAGRLLGLKTCVSLETRVYVPSFSDRVINSPGEPGIAYHMGAGFTRLPDPGSEAGLFLQNLQSSAADRNRGLLQRVNAFTHPLELDYDRDVLPLTPRGNATERHLCEAYARKAAEQYSDPSALKAFWMEKLGDEAAEADLPDGPRLQALFRARTMKQGGAGYIQPGQGAFPLMADLNRFALACGALPCLTWLDGLSEGEQAIDELMDIAAASGVAAMNIIPDRNFTPGVKDRKLEELHAVVERAETRGWPVIVGTELNSPGCRFVDDFEADELKPLVPIFLKGAWILWAHTALQQEAGMGYLSPWAASAFSDINDKNAFYAELGRKLSPSALVVLAGLQPDADPDRVLALLPASGGPSTPSPIQDEDHA